MAELIRLVLEHPLPAVLLAIGIALVATAMSESARTVKLLGGLGFLVAAAVAWWLQPPPGISVDKATWGHPTDIARQKDVTGHVRPLCEGKTDCSWQKNFNDFGDPWGGKQKSLVVEYRCSGKQQPKSVQLETQVVNATTTYALACKRKGS
ncbi:MAG: hypothetical protein GY725_08970 [bacterium]|nr:hypothetical protein [bacterium]